jgi:hypothetical protein
MSEPFDPFLIAHLAGPLIFDLSGRFSPPAIRDQLIRARMVIERLTFSNLTDPAGHGLFIVGAGVTGVAVAKFASELGVKSTVIERSKNCLGRFAECGSRLVDPTQYDWPRDNWDQGVAVGTPLPFATCPASILASAWRSELDRARFSGLVSVYLEVSEYQCTENGVPPQSLHCEWGGNGIVRGAGDFNALILCSGMGQEQSAVGSYRGFDFWETDPYEHETLELSDTPKILLSGSGDGALQDLLRVATGFSSVKDLMTSITTESVRSRLRHLVFSAEDHAQRCLLWSSGKLRDHQISREIDQIYSNLIDTRGHGTAGWDDMVKVLDQILIKRNSDGRELHLVHGCDHFSRCYALNRFFGKLIMARLVQHDATRFKVIQNSRTTRVLGTDHNCSGKPEECHGAPHSVSFESAKCDGTAALEPFSALYNVVSIHHGIDLPKNLGPKIRQLLPTEIRG